MTFSSVISVLREWAMRLLGSVRPRSQDAAYRAELAHHLELAEQRLRGQGYSQAEAARLARVRYGHSDSAVEDMRRQQGIPWFGAFTIDVKLGFRMLRKYFGLTLIGGLAMTVGFGIVVAVFVYFDVTTWSRSMPLDEGERVVAIQVWDSENSRRTEIGAQDFERWRAEFSTLEDVGAFRTVEYGIVHDNGEVEPVPVAEISPAGFDVARVNPILGRALREDDGRVGADPVLVIGYDEWRSRFDGDEDVIGQSLRFNDRFYTIVGVMPEDFGFPVNHQFWLPAQLSFGQFIWAPPAGAVFARLAAGTTIEQAQAELSSIGLLPADTSSERSQPLRPTVLPYASNFISDIDPDNLSSRALNARVVMFFVVLLLIPLFVNISMLVYARTVTRKGEIAVRTALGASRSRIVIQLFIEVLVLSTIALGLALIAVSLLMNFAEQMFLSDLGRLPFWFDFGFSIEALLFSVGLAVLSAVVIGLLPALSATRSYARPGLSALDSRTHQRLGPLWTCLVVAQIAFSFMALPSAIELGWGLLRSHVLGPGFAAETFLTVRLSGDTMGFTENDPELQSRFDASKEEFIRSVEADPRIRSGVAVASGVPGGAAQWRRFRIEAAISEVAEEKDTWLVIGSPPATRSFEIDDRYLDVYEITLLAGRGFEPGEHLSDSRTILIDATFAQDNFPDTNPVGRRIAFDLAPSLRDSDSEQQERWYEIVGVISDRPAHPYRGSVFHPVDRSDLDAVSIGFRAEFADGGYRQELRDLAARIDPVLEIVEIRSLQELYDSQAIGNYLGGFVLIVAGLTVLGLSAAGTYALMSFTVNQRRREIAIRMALGAKPRKLLRGVFRRAFRQLSIGAAIGLALALLIQSYMPLTVLGGLNVPGVVPSAIAFLVLLGLVASFGPARRALQTDPTECLSDQA